MNSVDWNKAIGQHLQALALAGVETLPRGVGRFEFSIENSLAEPTTASTAPPPAIKTPQSVDSKKQSASVNQHLSATENAPTATDPTDRIAETKTVWPATDPSSPNNSLSAGAKPHLVAPESFGPSLPLADRKSALQVLQQEVANCTRCSKLVISRTQTVFGVGHLTPRLVFVGEAPGADEDKLGEPFVGAAGELLNKIIIASKLKRDEVYILNTVKCRPPANRNPTMEELDHCWGYAEQQLEVLRPEFICCLGSVAAKRVLNTNQPLGRLRQKFHPYRGSRVMVTYHPAYLLRTQSAKKHVWEDMKMLMKEMGVDLSK
jgi:DNA polymerase